MAVKTMSFLDKLKKIPGAKSLMDIAPVKFHDTGIPIINLALSGSISGGIPEGITCFSAPAKSFKTLLALHALAQWQRDNPEGICLFWDVEMGNTPGYLKGLGIDTERVIIPQVAGKKGADKAIVTYEEFQISINDWLCRIETEEEYKSVKWFFILDSLGALVSAADVANTEAGELKADVGRTQKIIKTIFRMVGSRIKVAGIPFVVINQTYANISSYGGGQEVAGGSGIRYASDNIIVISKSKERDGSELIGYTFNMNPFASRLVRENVKIPFKVFYGKPIQKYTGLAEFGKELGIISGCKIGVGGAICSPELPDFKCKNSEVETNSEFWERIFKETSFVEQIEKYVRLAPMSTDDSALVEVDLDTGEILDCEDDEK